MSKPKFKVGDKVRCITAGESWIIKGTIYTVDKVLDNHAGADEHHYTVLELGSAYTPKEKRFVLANDSSQQSIVRTCACHANTYKDPETEHFYFCKKYESNKTKTDYS